MGEHKKASGSSNDVMGHLQFVLLNRLDHSKILVDKLEVKLSNYTSMFVNMCSKYLFFVSLVNQFSGGKADMDRDLGQLRGIGSDEKVFFIEGEKNRQKLLFDGAVSHGCDSTWSRGSSYAFFELFTSAERFIEHLEELEHVMDGKDNKIRVLFSQVLQMISEISSKISALEENKEIDNDGDIGDEEIEGDDEEEEIVEDEDEEVDDDGVDGKATKISPS